MPEFSLFAGNAPVTLYVGDNGGVFTNTGPSTVYYANGKVSTTSYDGTLATNASVTLYGSPHFTIGRSSEGAVRADVEYVALGATVTGGSGSGFTVLVYSASAYPTRPLVGVVPAGSARYLGPVQPSDWLTGDEWIDNS